MLTAAHLEFRERRGTGVEFFVVLMSGAAQQKRLQGSVIASADTPKLLTSFSWCTRSISVMTYSSRWERRIDLECARSRSADCLLCS